MDGIHVGVEPVTMLADGGESPEVGRLIAAAVPMSAVRGAVLELFRGPFLPGWDGRVTVIPSMAGQHLLSTLFIDVTVACEPGAEKASESEAGWWQHWTAGTAFCRRELAGLTAERLADLVRWRVGKMLGKFRLVELGACDQVTLDDDDTPPGFWEGVSPMLVLG